MPASVPRTLADGMTILGLPRKIDNTNIHRTRKCAVSFLLIFGFWRKVSTGHFLRQDNTLAYPGR